MILLLVALACLMAACRGGLGLRDAALRGSLAFGAAAVLITENLSLFGGLRPAPVAAAWALVIVAASAFAWSRGRLPRPSPPPWREVWLESLLLTGIAILAALIGVTAFVSAPNSADAMAYHLPRVLYWVQHASVAFFPTHYLNQLVLQPFAEYLTLQTWLLSGGDSYANLPQLGAYLLCVAGVSLVSRELGGDRRAQALSAALCATLPNIILQASGAKNDLVLAAGLVAFLYFGLRFALHRAANDLVYAAVAAGLALFTKGTAYLFLPPLGVVIVLWAGDRKARLLRDLVVAGGAAALLLNGPLYLRNERLSGSPLGFDSAHADGLFRWRNEPLSLRGLASNALRHTAEQLGARSERWNQRVYDWTLAAHAAIGADPADPGTTWRWSVFEPPRNANHEADKNNRFHLLLYALALAWALWTGRGNRANRDLALLGAALAAGFFLFCFYLKWQPFQVRMLAPLYVLAAPLGACALRATPAIVQLAVCLLLFDGARLPATENWTRPLEGEHSIFAIDRSEGYFADLTPWDNRQAYIQSANWVAASGCRDVGLDLSEHQIEYPLLALLRERDQDIHFRHIHVRNPSARYADPGLTEPCAAVCMECAGRPDKLELYRDYPRPFEKDGFLVFLKARSK
jgi:4-amino-4-deoxy-L-arabinose transferase-like glycosyltransferase